MNSKLTKTALVTGANRGIGFAVCQGLLEANFRVIIGSRILEKGKEAAEKLNSPLVYGAIALSSLFNSIMHLSTPNFLIKRLLRVIERSP